VTTKRIERKEYEDDSASSHVSEQISSKKEIVCKEILCMSELTGHGMKKNLYDLSHSYHNLQTFHI
jgi:hypothetical protein